MTVGLWSLLFFNRSRSSLSRSNKWMRWMGWSVYTCWSSFGTFSLESLAFYFNIHLDDICIIQRLQYILRASHVFSHIKCIFIQTKLHNNNHQMMECQVCALYQLWFGLLCTAQYISSYFAACWIFSLYDAYFGRICVEYFFSGFERVFFFLEIIMKHNMIFFRWSINLRYIYKYYPINVSINVYRYVCSLI